MEKQLFFQAATAGLGKYCIGGYGRIGVYRVKMNMLEDVIVFGTAVNLLDL